MFLVLYIGNTLFSVQLLLLLIREGLIKKKSTLGMTPTSQGTQGSKDGKNKFKTLYELGWKLKNLFSPQAARDGKFHPCFKSFAK